MRGEDLSSGRLFSYVDLENRVPGAHPLRVVREIVNEVLAYVASQRVRKRIEEVFGWIKASAGLRKAKLAGLERMRSQFTLALAAYNLIRLPELIGASP